MKGETVFIIGGGSSRLKYLPDDKLQFLSGRRIIVTNDAYLLYPEAFLLHFGDAIWYNWNEHKIKEVWRGKYITTCADNFRQSKEIIYLKKEANNHGLSASLYQVCGSNSGHHAINIAINLGANKLVLIGFDMNVSARETHWHHNHKRALNRSQYSEVMLPGLNKTAPLIAARGIEVFNVNPDSAIKCFPYAPLESFL